MSGRFVVFSECRACSVEWHSACGVSSISSNFGRGLDFVWLFRRVWCGRTPVFSVVEILVLLESVYGLHGRGLGRCFYLYGWKSVYVVSVGVQRRTPLRGVAWGFREDGLGVYSFVECLVVPCVSANLVPFSARIGGLVRGVLLLVPWLLVVSKYRMLKLLSSRARSFAW